MRAVSVTFCPCRDRAKERREGRVAAEYERVEEELETILQGRGLGNDLSKLTVADSKFLGGDLDHTHLVKGLDYALLQKASPWTSGFLPCCSAACRSVCAVNR
jgi:hypothetical protein